MTADPVVFLVDDEQPVLVAMSRLLRASGFRTREFDSARRFLDTCDRSAAGCLLLDMAMPGLDGLQVQARLPELGIHLPVVFLTGRADVPMTVSAMKRGAVDFLTKPVDEASLISAVRRALATDAKIRQDRAQREDIRRRASTLTPREREVMAQVVEGKLNKQVAAALGTAEKTIKIHRSRVMEKMQADSLAALVRLAQKAAVESDGSA